MIYRLLIICILFSVSGFSQNFNIYTFKGRYNAETEQYFKNHKIFKRYNLLSLGNVDPKKTGNVDFAVLKKSIEKLYPNNSDEGFLNVDIENEWFKNLKNYNPEDEEYKTASGKFVSILKYIKKLRPNVKLGVYGIPFRFNYDKQKRANYNKTYSEIFEYCDYISPSLYVSFTEKEKGKDFNYNFLKQNMNLAFSISKKLNKPVIPFFWYMVNINNDKYGGEIIDKQTLRNYVEFIKSYNYDGVKVKGILWWDPSDASFTKLLQKSKTGIRRKHLFNDRNEIVKYYNLHTIK